MINETIGYQSKPNIARSEIINLTTQLKDKACNIYVNWSSPVSRMILIYHFPGRSQFRVTNSRIAYITGQIRPIRRLQLNLVQWVSLNNNDFVYFRKPWIYAWSHKIFGPYRFSCFDVYWTLKRTDTQTEREAKYIYMTWIICFTFFCFFNPNIYNVYLMLFML